MPVKTSLLFEIARVVARLDHVASIIVHADHSIIAIESGSSCALMKS
jgi:hypothetical protein